MTFHTKPPIYSVTQLNELVNETLTREIGPVLVAGEVSGISVRRQRWLTFELKDAGSVVSCFGVVDRLGSAIEDGMEVKILASPRIYVPYGKYSLNIQAIEPVGIGALRRSFQLLLGRLKQEGLFEAAQKQQLPPYPQTIGLITSPDGAALHDVRRILAERWGGFQLLLAPVPVQGREAARAIVRAIEYFNARRPVDILILTRGGGSLEDLQAFNDERVARAVFASRIPTIVGIGHETDETIAELVADQRAATPSNAAQLAVPDRATVRLTIKAWVQRIRTANNRKLTATEQTLHHSRVAAHSQLERAFREIERTTALIHSLDPKRILKRGYSVTLTQDRRVVRTATDVQPGSEIVTRLAHGSIHSRVL